MGLAYFAAQSSFLRQIFVLLFSARDCLFEKSSGPDRQRPAEAGESGAIDIQRSQRMPRSGSRVFVGNLPESARERDLERFFEKYGRIRSGH